MAVSYLALAMIAVVACWLACQIWRIVMSVKRARRNMLEAQHSSRHQAEVRIFLAAQRQLTRMDIQMGAMFGIWLIAMVALAGKLLLGLQSQS